MKNGQNNLYRENNQEQTNYTTIQRMVINHKNGNTYLEKSEMNAAIQRSQQSWNISNIKKMK